MNILIWSGKNVTINQESSFKGLSIKAVHFGHSYWAYLVEIWIAKKYVETSNKTKEPKDVIIFLFILKYTIHYAFIYSWQVWAHSLRVEQALSTPVNSHTIGRSNLQEIIRIIGHVMRNNKCSKMFLHKLHPLCIKYV